MAKLGSLMEEVLIAFGIRKAAPRTVQPTLTRKRTGWWGKVADAADRRAFDWPTREAFYDHLATQVENEVPVEDAIDSFAVIMLKRKRKSVHSLLSNVSRRMRDGMTLRKAISIALPRDELAILAGGEVSTKLGSALDLIVASRDRIDAIMRAYKSAGVRPLMYLAMTYGLLWVTGAVVMPNITQGLPEDKVQGVGLVMYKAADYSQSWLSLLPPLLCVAIFLAVRWSFPRWTGPNRIKAESYFPYSFYRDIEGYKWLSVFSDLLETGLPNVHVLALQMEMANPWLRERLWHIRYRMTEGGKTLAEALEERSANGKLPPFEFPNPMIIDRIRSIDGYSGFNEKVVRLTRRWAAKIERDALSKAKKSGAYAEIAMYALMFFLIWAINSVTTQLGAIGGV